MKRMHLHIAVEDLDQSINFYNSLFGATPTVTKADYAKWLLDDPAVNFAISTRGETKGIDHIGIQADNEVELAEIKSRLESAEMDMVSQEGTSCCYAKSDKHWVQDPSGIAWETYNTLESIPTFNDKNTAEDAQAESVSDSACCAPEPKSMQFIKQKNSCC